MNLEFQDLGPQALVVEDENDLAEVTANVVAEVLKSILESKSRAYFIPSAGRTPIKTYQILARRYRNVLDWSRVTAVQMDEYWSDTLAECLYFDRFLILNVVEPLGLGGFFSMHRQDGSGMFAPQEYTRRLQALGPIGLALHGIGRNGHIGFNEPGAPESSETRIVNLALETQIDNFPHLPAHRVPQFGITLGLKDLQAVKHSILIASGHSKAQAIQGLLERGPVSKTPANILWNSEDFGLIVDKEAAGCVAELRRMPELSISA